MINRFLKNRIVDRLSSSDKIVIIYGSRQVGKTTLVREILKEIPYRSLAINADRREYEEVLSSRNLGRLKRLVSGYELLFIDEAQRIQDIGINLKILHDELPELKIIATGSSSFELANTIKEPLTGRTWTYTLYPIALLELTTDQNPFELDLRLEEFLLFGMYPEVFSFQQVADKKEYLRELSSAYLYKDILELGDIRNARAIYDLLRLLAYQIGATVSMNELGRQLGLNHATVARYIDLLEKAFVIFRLSGFSRNLRKEIVKMDKFFFYDLGIRNAVIENFNELDKRDDVGRLWENFLIIERLKYAAYHRLHPNRYFWRTYTGAELDYVEEKDGQLHGFEFKWGSKKIPKPPKSWQETYTQASFQPIGRHNYLDFIS